MALDTEISVCLTAVVLGQTAASDFYEVVLQAMLCMIAVGLLTQSLLLCSGLPSLKY